jgi:hypothetical protein
VKAKNRAKGILFLLRSDKHLYGKLVEELANDYNKGRDSYPSSVVEAYELMLHDVRDDSRRGLAPGNSGVSFYNNGNVQLTGTNTQPNNRPDITCHRYNRTGHFAKKVYRGRVGRQYGPGQQQQYTDCQHSWCW